MMIIIIMKCACCGGEMLADADIGPSVIYKCKECGLTDSRLKSSQNP